MASSSEGGEEYDSGSEETFNSLSMRRREATDDEEVDGETKRNWGDVCSGDESEGLGLAPEESEDGESYIDDLEALGGLEFQYLVEEEEEGSEEREIEDQELGVADEAVEVEPFVVPRVGLFFMHDDRWSIRGRNRTPGRARGRGRQHFCEGKVWAPEDKEKGQHDKFGELTLKEDKWQHDKFEEEMRLIAQNEGHIRNPGGGGHVKAYNSRPHGYVYNDNNSPRFVKGRGPVKYKPLTWISDAIPFAKPEISLKAQQGNPNISPARILRKAFGEMGSTNSTSASRRSSLPKNFASFSSNDDNASPDQNWDSQPGRTQRYFPATGLQVDEFHVPKSNYFVQETSLAKPIGQEQRQNKDSIHLANWTSQPFQSSENRSTDMTGSYHSKFESMQFESQHRYGHLLPANHTAFPGYAAESHLLTGTSEPTWSPVFARPAYHSTSTTLDDDYFYNMSGKIFSYGIYGADENKPPDKNGSLTRSCNVLAKDPSQQGKKMITRYSEMKFGKSSQ